MRFAFLTTEYPTVLPDGGGLGTYVSRMAALLVDGGHEAEVFVVQPHRSDVVRQGGVVVRHVLDAPPPGVVYARRALGRLGFRRHAEAMRFEATAARAAEALEAVHAARPFDVVQSADYCGVGLRVPKRPGRVHVVRCSSAVELYHACDGYTGPHAEAQIAIELAAVRAADLAYAPSDLVAGHYRRQLGREVHVVRPPAFLETEPGARPVCLPERYLVHFAGQLRRRKGTNAILDALPLVFQRERDLKMIFIGRISSGELRYHIERLEEFATNVLFIYPLPKPLLYAVVRDAIAAVLPSVIDNIPNTAIESLLLGVPVIGTLQGSVDEIVEHGVTGVLTPPCQPSALAEAIVAAWRGDIHRQDAQAWLGSSYGCPFNPDVSLESLLKLVRSHA